MKKISFIVLLITLAWLGTGCDSFEELQDDPNRPTMVPPSLALKGILNDITYSPWNEEQRWNQYWCINYNYYGNNEYNWTSGNFRYATLKNVIKMEEEAARLGLDPINPYTALGKFFRAYLFTDMTLRMGDVPMKNALKGSLQVNPAYDTQEDIFLQVLVWLDEANAELARLIEAHDTNLSGDFYYNGNLVRWQKAVNTFKIRVLIHLSHKENDSELNVKGRFADVINHPDKHPIMVSMDDNMQFVWSNFDKYPLNRDNFGFYALRYNMAATYVNTLAQLHDPRVLLTAEPATAEIAAGKSKEDFSAYAGAPSGESLDDMSYNIQVGKYSLINKDRYFNAYEGEPTIQIGYPELQFNLAEAVNRGWIGGDAGAFYREGIRASMSFYGITDAAVLQAYLDQPNIQYAGHTPDGLAQILTQKYLAFFQNSGLEAFYNQRRTGIPAFSTGTGTGNSSRIPKRFQYPTSERDNNPDHYQEALNRQFGNVTDDINETFWLLK